MKIRMEWKRTANNVKITTHELMNSDNWYWIFPPSNNNNNINTKNAFLLLFMPHGVEWLVGLMVLCVGDRTFPIIWVRVDICISHQPMWWNSVEKYTVCTMSTNGKDSWINYRISQVMHSTSIVSSLNIRRIFESLNDRLCVWICCRLKSTLLNRISE